MNQYTVIFSYELRPGRRARRFLVLDADTEALAIARIKGLYLRVEILSIRHNTVKLPTITEQS